jgi:hypothetical protein
MTPKEKAKELAIKFSWVTDVVKPNYRSIHQAIKAVDEIIKNNAFPCSIDSDIICNVDFWLNVDHELNKLLCTH